MLVLSRKVGEVVRIGEDIQLVILGIVRGKVLIGIDAPKDKRILREELKQT